MYEPYQKPLGFTIRRTEESIDGVTNYAGYSALGEATDSEKWAIVKTVVTTTETEVTTVISHASGAWDDRATLTYE